MRREIGGAMTDDSVVALRLRMDITHGLSSFYRVDSELQRLEAARWTLDNMERDMRRKLASLSETAAVLRWREKALDTQRSQAREVQSLYKEQFIVGMRDITDLLTIETELFEAERQMVNTRSERQRTLYRTAAQVGLLVPWLDGRLAEGSQI
ncbi:Outer membrane efflux protein [compost metagenome]